MLELSSSLFANINRKQNGWLNFTHVPQENPTVSEIEKPKEKSAREKFKLNGKMFPMQVDRVGEVISP